MNPAMSVGRHVIDDRLELVQQFLIGERRQSPRSGGALLHTFPDVEPGDTQGLANRVIANRSSAARASTTGVF